MKIRPMGTDFFHADGKTDGQTDLTQVTVAFRDSAKVLNNGKIEGKMLICGNAERFGLLGLFLQG